MRLLRYLLVSCSAAAMAGAVTFTGVTAASVAAAPARSHEVPSARFLAEARAVLAGYLRHNHPQAMLVHPGRVLGPAGTTTAIGSTNWSGYADVSQTSQEFTRVSGSWTTPSVTCTAEDQVSSDWVGFDGLTNTSVEQLGTISWCYEGKPLYITWYEMSPNPAVQVAATLKAGDKITASVTRTGTSYTLKLTDATNTVNSFTKTLTCALTTCTDTSAEWISERPAFAIGVAPQAHYNAFKITNGTETAGGKSGTIGSFATNDAITMLDATSAYDLATVSTLIGGNSFSTTWKNSY